MRLNNNVYKPRAYRNLGVGAYHLGIELEVEAPNHYTLHRGLGSKRAGVVYAKRDGSLGEYGVELVTHPIGCDSWLKLRVKNGPVLNFLTYVEQLRQMKFTSHEAGGCGLHVHVSRTAFRDRPHLYWFGRLVNSTVFELLSQRTNFRYCEQVPFSVAQARNGKNNGDTRYEALNLMSPCTAEVRIFRGNMRGERIRKAVEACIAGVELARTLTSKEFFCDVSRLFRDYVDEHRTIYPNLYAYLNTKPRELPECASSSQPNAASSHMNTLASLSRTTRTAGGSRSRRVELAST